MPNASKKIEWQRAIVTMGGIGIVVTSVFVLYWAQVILIPLAMAIFFAFMLNPFVRALERRKLPRVPAVLIVVVACGLLASTVTWTVGQQVTNMVNQLPDHTARIKAKIRSVRERKGTLSRLSRMFGEISGELKSGPQPAPASDDHSTTSATEVAPGSKPTSVVVVQPEVPSWLRNVPSYLGSAAESLAALVLTFVLTVIILLRREDLRNRFLRLVANGHMSSTTKAVNDAGDRVSRYLLTQAFVNCSFGVCVTIGLYLLNVDYCLLWGLVAAFMRYVPYLGTWIAAFLPITLSLATSDDWWRPFAVFGVYLMLELVIANVVEPWLYGQSMGVSSLAQIISAAFWAFLWGPLGLVLSAPLTAVLVVLGKYVPQLAFLEILLGEKPALEPDVTYYQRLLARDQDEAEELVLTKTTGSPPEQVYDELLLPALYHARRDRISGDLPAEDEEFILKATREMLEDLGHQRTLALADDPTAAPAHESVRVLACPARDEADRLSLEMLAQVLTPSRWAVEITAVETLTSELLDQASKDCPALICIGSLPPGGLAHTRYLCKRLRAKFPDIRIIVGRWGIKSNIKETRQHFLNAGADQMTTSLLETRAELNGWFPVLSQEQEQVLAT